MRQGRHSRCRKASSHGLRSEEQYSSSGPWEEHEPRKISQDNLRSEHCTVHEPPSTWPRPTDSQSPKASPFSHSLQNITHPTCWLAHKEKARLCAGGPTESLMPKKALLYAKCPTAKTSMRLGLRGHLQRGAAAWPEALRAGSRAPWGCSSHHAKALLPTSTTHKKGSKESKSPWSTLGYVCPAVFHLGEKKGE